MNDVVLNQIAIRFGGQMPVEVGDEITRKVISAVQEVGVCFTGGAQWKGRWIMRFSVIGFPCTDADALRSVDSIASNARAITEEYG